MIIENLIKKILKEATTEKASRGSYLVPLLPGYREFPKNQIAPFTEFVTQWDDAMLDHDSMDGKMSTSKKIIKKREKRAEKISNYIKNNPDSFAWADDAGIINGLPGKNTDAKPIKNFNPKKTVTKLGEWVEINDEVLSEDLAVWFGKKKKPKGSSQPKGPWVDICRKVDGKHPPCGRSDASEGSYPKCRAAGVAGKMSDSEKRSACQQKRKAEKNDPQSGKGQKPVMVSHKKKTNESMKNNIITLTESDIRRIVKRILKEENTNKPELNCDWFISNTNLVDGKIGELHLIEESKGNWILEKYSDVNDDKNFIVKKIRVPQASEIQVEWDEDTKTIKLVGDGLIGLEAYNILHNTNEPPESCNVLFASESYPSEYGVPRSQYLNIGKVTYVKNTEPNKIPMELIKLKDGAVATYGTDIFVDKKLLKSKEYYHLSMKTDESFGRSLNKCDKYDVGKY